MSLAGLALVGAFTLDVLVGEPPRRLHPVAWFGRVAAAFDRDYRRPRLVGTLLTVGLSLGAAAVVSGAVALGTVAGPGVATLVGAVALFASTSLRRLLARGREVAALLEEDLPAARENLRALAGRDAETLSPAQIRSTVVESLAENLADGLVGPLTGFTLLSWGAGTLRVSPGLALAAGCGGAAWVKAVNTLDSMLGYHAKPTGWAPARLDDAVMWVPARLTALLLAGVSRAPLAPVRARRWVDAVPSPNAGWPMGTLAAILDVRLEKPDTYVLNPDSTLPDAKATSVAVRKVALTGAVAWALAGVVVWS